MQEKIKTSDLDVEKAKPKHKELLPTFTASNKELKDFLVEDALKNQDLAISTTYLFFYRPANKLVAYMTLLSDSLRIKDTELEKVFVEKGILYKSLPAVKLGRLCVDDNFKGRGIGTILAETAMFIATRTINPVIGCRFVVLDAKKDSVEFYKKIGFKILKEENKETIPMFFDLIDLINAYRKS